jgi:hypothetical protein
MQMIMTASFSLHDRMVLLQCAHFSVLFNWMCRYKSAASDRFIGSWLCQHFQSEESVEKFVSWTAGSARFISGINGEILAESLGDLIQEHIHGAIRRGANGDDRAMALINSSLRQVLAQQLRTKFEIPPHFGASRNRTHNHAAVIRRADADELSSVRVVGAVFTWIVDNWRLFGLPIPPNVETQLRELAVWSESPELRLIVWRPPPSRAHFTTIQDCVARVAGYNWLI